VRRFHFNLERILALRKHEEHEVEMRLAAVQAEVVDLRNRIDDARARIGNTYGVTVIAGRRVDMSQSYAGGAYQAYLEAHVQTLRRQLEEREEKRKELADEYREAYKKRKVLDNLKERREREYYAEARRQEAGVLDEIGSANHHVRREEEI
jgi:flagellar export protein FliJ